jgi:apoptosis-inducing factor 3
MTETDPAAGPDLGRGIPETAVPDGGMLRGLVDGEPVVLLRRGAAWYAVGANCTHYGGELVDGAFAGTTLRCPLHHACFDVRTGAATRAPALAPLASYTVERQAGQVRVTGRRSGQPAAPAAAAAGARNIVIIGAGAAGTAAAITLRREGFTGRIELLTEEAAEPYDRPLLSKEFLAGTASDDWLPIRPRSELDALGIELVQRATAVQLQPGAHAVRLSDGRTLRYDALLLATGAGPIRIPLPGAQQPRVRTLRSLADARTLVERAQQAASVVVIGAGFLGLEIAAALRARDLPVRVVAPEARPLERVLGPELGGWLQRLHEAHGVKFHLGRKPARIDDRMVRLDDGTGLEGDLIVMATGVRPRTALAGRAGLVINRGILVDRMLETSVRGIFAAGDVARWPDPRTGELIGVEHWALAERQGQAAARNMLGQAAPFEDVPFFWSQHYDHRINYVGHASHWDELAIVPGLPDGEWEQRYLLNGAVVAVATMGRDRVSLAAELELERAPVPAGARASLPGVFAQ